MQLAHAADDRFPRLLFKVGLEGGILLGEAGQSLTHAHLGFLVGGLDGERDDRSGHIHGGHGIAHLPVGERVARGAVDAEQGGDASRRRTFDFFHFIRVHPHQSPDLRAFSGAHVDDGVPLFRVPW